MIDRVPEVRGVPDRTYLKEALGRAGREAPTADVVSEPLTGGRTGAQVIRLDAGGETYVLKQLPDEGWRTEGMRCADGGEPRLWLKGPVRELTGVRFPVIDVARDPSTGVFWMLMEDVGEGIRPRGKFTRRDSETLFRALAHMQRPFWGDDALRTAPLPHVADTIRVFTEPILHFTERRLSERPWVTAFLDGFVVLGALLPLFLDVLDPEVADDYLSLCADTGWLAELEEHPHGLLHGDLRRANISFEGDGGIALIDWEFAAVGPPACDLQWHCFLHYWGYPPDGVMATDDHCHDLRDAYADALEANLGEKIDRSAFARSWELGWIKVVCQLAYVLADPLHGVDVDPEEVDRVRKISAAAIRRAVQARAS